MNFIIDKVVQVNKSNHKMSDSEPLEEWLFQTWLFYRAFVFEFPISYDDPELNEMFGRIEDWRYKFVKSCIARVIYYRRTPGKDQTYVGCPLTYIRDIAFLRKHYPHARFVITVRDPREALPSLIDYLTKI